MTRRLAITAIVALAAAGTLGASAATAETADTGTRALRVDDEYIACFGVRTIDVATCVEEPLGPIFDLVLP